jgi:hypothetical protein
MNGRHFSIDDPAAQRYNTYNLIVKLAKRSKRSGSLSEKEALAESLPSLNRAEVVWLKMPKKLLRARVERHGEPVSAKGG